MRHRGLWLAGLCLCTRAFAATDPFVGTWVYDAQKSPKPTIRYAIKDLGAGRYALTGSTGITVEVKPNGIPIKTPAGATVSFRQLDAHTWEMVRDDGEKMVRTYTISPDDQSLTLHDVFSGNAGGDYGLTTTYRRLHPGKGIFGEWQSVSMEEKDHGNVPTMVIAPFENGGLSFSVPIRKHQSQMKFDGKPYADSGAGDAQGHSSSGRRLSDDVIAIDGQANGKLEEHSQLTVSKDGKTLTVVDRPVHSTAVFTEIWDKR